MKNSNKYEPADQSHVFTSFPVAHNDEEDMQNLIEKSDDQQPLGTIEKEISLEKNIHSFWQIEFYQKYFNVNTNEVLARILGSMTPTFNSRFLQNKIRPNPDLYGPFWVSITLIFTVAIAGNIISFFKNFGSSQYVWQTDFHKVSSSAACIMTYWWLLPTVLYILMRWRENQADYKFLEVLCLYGYSLSIYIPLSLLWLVNISFLQWIFTITAALLSGSVLVCQLWPAFKHDSNKKITYLIMGLILICHALLASGFMLYFFHYPNQSNSEDVRKTSEAHLTFFKYNTTSVNKVRKSVEEILTITQSMITGQVTKSDFFTTGQD